MNKKQLIAVWVMGILVFSGCSKPTKTLSIKGTWEPLSKVYLNFGNMTIKDDLIRWVTGQKSSFKIISSEKKETVIQFTNKILPRFHGDVYKFIRFVSKLGKTTQETELEVSFYEESQRLDDKNAMWGIYIKPKSASSFGQ